MSNALSLDLRSRVLAAVAGGASHRRAASRFGVRAVSLTVVGARLNESRELPDQRPWAAIAAPGVSKPKRS